MLNLPSVSRIDFRQMPPPDSMGIYFVGDSINDEIVDYGQSFLDRLTY